MAYTTSATTKGGRNGRAILENNGLALAMGLQKEFGGNGEGHNPEQLFTLGWSACFGQAILALARKHDLDGQDARVTCALSMDKDDVSFGFKVEMKFPFRAPTRPRFRPWLRTRTGFARIPERPAATCRSR
jgi:osmotically inducible protein OsmC